MDSIDKDFFRELESKLSYVKADDSRWYHPNHFEDDDFQKVLKTINSNPQVILYPAPGPHNLFPTFVLGVITNGSGENQLEELLHFSKQQLPQHYSFSTLSRIFADPVNIAKAKSCGVSYSTQLEDYRPKSTVIKKNGSFLFGIFGK